MFGEGIRIEPSTEVLITGREKFCRLLVLCEGVGPPEVDGRTPGADMTACCCGRNLIDEFVLGWPESVDTSDSDESLRCELVDCDREPPGECGRGGGRSGGKRSLMVARYHTYAQ